MNKQEKIVIGDDRAGIEVGIKKEGIEIFGWYNYFVGLCDPKLIPWEKIDELRVRLSNRKGNKQ